MIENIVVTITCKSLRVYVLTSRTIKISWNNYFPLYHLKNITKEKVYIFFLGYLHYKYNSKIHISTNKYVGISRLVLALLCIYIIHKYVPTGSVLIHIFHSVNLSNIIDGDYSYENIMFSSWVVIQYIIY